MTRKFFFVRKSRTEREKNGNTPKRFEKYIIYHIALYQCMKTTAYTFNMIFGHCNRKVHKTSNSELWAFELQKFAARTSGQMILFVLSGYFYVPNLKNKYHHNSTKQLIVIQFLSTQNHEVLKSWISSPKGKKHALTSVDSQGLRNIQDCCQTLFRDDARAILIDGTEDAFQPQSRLNQGTRPGGL